jgi:oxygen-independent coproporphyrinogen-3 oxidase
MLVSHLANEGFEQYEISNFAFNNQYARHNTSYWKQEEYLGVGPSAHSFNLHSRQYNIANNGLYLKSIQKNELPAEIETLSAEDQVNEYLLTGLRTKWGCSLEKLNQYSGRDFRQWYEQALNVQISEGFLKIENNVLLITPKGKLFVDRIASDLFL